MATFRLVTLLLLAASSFAITVTSPSQGTTWSSSSPNTVTWFEVNTDPTSFAITLVQQGVFKQVLAENVDGTKNSLTITATLPVGSVYQVNIVKSFQEVDTILAQSAQFNITGGGASGSSGGETVTSASGLTATSKGAITSGGNSPTPGTPTSAPISSSIVSLEPTKSNAFLTSRPSSCGAFLTVLTFLVIMFV